MTKPPDRPKSPAKDKAINNLRWEADRSHQLADELLRSIRLRIELEERLRQRRNKSGE